MTENLVETTTSVNELNKEILKRKQAEEERLNTDLTNEQCHTIREIRHARVNVGKRMITLQNELREREKLQGVLEMAGAICHELNQPLQSVSGFSELLLMDMETGSPNYKMLKNIKTGIERIGDLTRKIMNITRYQSKPYLNESKIIDIEKASRHEEKGE